MAWDTNEDVDEFDLDVQLTSDQQPEQQALAQRNAEPDAQFTYPTRYTIRCC